MTSREEQIKFEKEKDQYVQKLLEGKEPVPNEVSSFLLEKLKDTNAEFKAVLQTLQQAEQVVAQSKQRGIEIRGVLKQYADNLYEQRKDADSPDEKRIVTP
jgi:hypothetical protein